MSTLFSSLSLMSSLSLFTPLSCLSLSSQLFLSLLSSLSLSFHLTLFLSQSLVNVHSLLSENDNDHLFSRLSLFLFVLTALTYPVCQTAWPLTHSLIGELLAPCRNKLCRCTCSDIVPLERSGEDGDVFVVCLCVLWCRLCVCCGVVCVCVCVCRCGVACLVDCRRYVVCCTLTFAPDVDTSFGYIQEVMVTSAVCPRLFECLTTSTFGAQSRNHIVSTAFETIAPPKKQR